MSPQFIFLYPTFNFRNTEIGAVIGLNQLKRLNKNNSLRTRNFKLFLKLLDPLKIELITHRGSSNYAIPIIFKNKSLEFRKSLRIL